MSLFALLGLLGLSESLDFAGGQVLGKREGIGDARLQVSPQLVQFDRLAVDDAHCQALQTVEAVLRSGDTYSKEVVLTGELVQRASDVPVD